MSRFEIRAVVFALVWPALFAAAGCTEDHPCNDSSRLVKGVCLPKRAPTFETPCNVMAECMGQGAVTDFCYAPAIPGYCTARCEGRPAICPPGWGCANAPSAGPIRICLPGAASDAAVEDASGRPGDAG